MFNANGRSWTRHRRRAACHRSCACLSSCRSARQLQRCARARLIDGLADPARRRRARARFRARLRRAVVRLRRDREVEPGPQRRHGRDGRVDARARARLPEASAVARLDAVGLVQGLPARRLGLHPARGRRPSRSASFWRSSSCAEWLAREKLAAVPFLLAAIPFYNFLGLKFDQNSVLIPLWALAMWAMLRALDTRHARLGGARRARRRRRDADEILVGVPARRARACGAVHPKRRDYFRSAAPWVTAGVFLVAVAPHVVVADRARISRRSPG